jgi:hypothetical protein
MLEMRISAASRFLGGDTIRIQHIIKAIDPLRGDTLEVSILMVFEFGYGGHT